MNFEMVKAWLDKQTHAEIKKRWLYAALGLALLPFATIIGGALIFRGLCGITKDWDRPHVLLCLLATLGILGAMFIINLLIQRHDEPEKYYHEDTDDALDSISGRYLHRRKVQARFFLWIALTGPRLLRS